jgi:type 1 glutamine amidotransferase
MLPQLGKVLAKHHGFKCTVLFSVNKKGEIDPNNRKNIPGLEALKKADLMVMFLRFRELPDEQMKHIADYVESGKPIVAFRTATHAFNFPDRKSKYHPWHYTNKGGFGKKVLGETWVSHHGGHGSESTLGMVAKKAKDHPILRGISDGDVWGPTDVYGVKLPLPGDSKPLVLGQVVAGMKPTDPPAKGKKNDPMMPIAWVKTYKTEGGKSARVFTSTMASSQDFQSEGFRRLCVNACYWAVGLEEKIPAKSKVDLVGDFKATPFGNDKFKKGVKPADLKW